MNTYRVWMKDGYARLVSAYTEKAARASAVKKTKVDIEGAAMSAGERRRAVTVDYVDNLDARREGGAA